MANLSRTKKHLTKTVAFISPSLVTLLFLLGPFHSIWVPFGMAMLLLVITAIWAHPYIDWSSSFSFLLGGTFGTSLLVMASYLMVHPSRIPHFSGAPSSYTEMAGNPLVPLLLLVLAVWVFGRECFLLVRSMFPAQTQKKSRLSYVLMKNANKIMMRAQTGEVSNATDEA